MVTVLLSGMPGDLSNSPSTKGIACRDAGGHFRHGERVASRRCPCIALTPACSSPAAPDRSANDRRAVSAARCAIAFGHAPADRFSRPGAWRTAVTAWAASSARAAGPAAMLAVWSGACGSMAQQCSSLCPAQGGAQAAQPVAGQQRFSSQIAPSSSGRYLDSVCCRDRRAGRHAGKLTCSMRLA